MIVISDTSPITNLIQIERLGLLREIFEEITIPVAVYEELCEIQPQKLILESLGWVVVKEITDKNLVTPLIEILDKGEAASICLAIELKGDLVLIDERKGRKVAKSKGLKVMGLIGVLTEAKTRGLISNLKPILERLTTTTGFWIHPKLYEKVLAYVDEI